MMREIDRYFLNFLRVLYNGKVSLLFYILALLPLFFIENIYGTYVYIILFIYFIGEIIFKLRNKAYKRKWFIIIDILSSLGLITTYKFLILMRVIKLLAEVKGITIITNVYADNKDLFKSVLYLVIAYIVAVSLLVFNVEPKTFDSQYYNALYWAVITLTGIGYGDITPVTILGKAITTISAFIGIAIVALPTGLISREFLKQKRYEIYEENNFDTPKANNNNTRIDEIERKPVDEELINYNIEKFEKENEKLSREEHILIKAHIQLNLEKGAKKFTVNINSKTYNINLVHDI